MSVLRAVKSWFWNSGEHRLRSGWRILIFVAVIALAVAITGLLIGHVLPQLGIAARSLEPITMLTGLLTGGLSLLGLWLVARRIDKRPLADFGFACGQVWWRELAVGTAIGAAMMAAIFAIEWAAGLLQILSFFQGSGFGLDLLIAFVAYCGAALFEEVATRVYVVRNLIEGLSGRFGPRSAAWIAVVLPGLVFGALHYPNPGSTLVSTSAVAFAGIVGGAIYVLNGRIAIVLGVHLAWNFAQGSIFGFAVSGTDLFTYKIVAIRQLGPDWLTGGSFGPEAGVVGVGTWGATAAFFAWRHRGRFAAMGVAFAAPPFSSFARKVRA